MTMIWPKIKYIMEMGIGIAVVLPFALIVLLAAGSVTSVLLVRDGLDLFTGERRVAAEDALLSARLALEPGDRLLWPWFKVIELELEPGFCVPNKPSLRRYRAVLRQYTLFAVPIRMLYVSCGSGSRSP